MIITTVPKTVETLIIGAGHAGLAMSGMLTQSGQEHLVLERRDRLGGGWQDRWDRVTQLHSHQYRNSSALPAGGVLFIGSAQTGVQLAEELFEDGRHVYLSVGSAGRVPRRYRGRDIFRWLVDILRQGREME